MGSDVRSPVRRWVVGAVIDDAPLLGVIVVLIVGSLFLQRITGYPAHISWTAWWRLFSAFALLYAFFAAVVTLIYTVIVRKRSLRIRRTWEDLARSLWSPQECLNFVLLTVAFVFVMPIFLGYKQSIPIVHPFSLDAVFMHWDRLLHLGRHPFEWLQPMLGSPRITWLIDRTYFLWLHVMWVTVIWQTWHGSRDTPVRSQFLLAFILCWILIGTAFTTLLSSAGPIFFARVAGSSGDPYRPLLDYLYSVDVGHELRALRLRGFLWQAYLSPNSASIGGISAMPSMHVSVVTLLTLLGFSVNQRLGWAYLAFAVVIFLGSIHLAWHYAIDGYVAVGLTVGIWSLSGCIVRTWRNGHRFRDLMPPISRSARESSKGREASLVRRER